MASHVIKRHLFDFVETKQDNIAHGALACQNTLFIQRVALIANAHGIAVYILKDKVPESLAGLGIEVQNHCYDYVGAAHEKGLTVSLGQIFPSDSLEEDFDPVEIGAQSWQPKLNVLTERFDALELVNALDQELVDEFVTQLSTGGDAFALIDAKVLVETQRAVNAEAVLTGDLAAEVTAREADVDAESAALQILITAVQTDVDQNETDADAAISAEATRAQGVEATNAAAVVTEAAARAAAITAEGTARTAAISTAIDGLVDSAPGTLNTLNELAAALNDDDDFHAAVTTSLTAKQDNLSFGIADLDSLRVTGTGAAAGNFARFTATGLEPRAKATFKADLTLVKADVGLANVENSALSSFAGSTNVVQVGTVASGVWQGTAIADAYIASDVVDGHQFSTSYRNKIDANEAVLGTRTATQLSQVDATSSIQTQLDAGAPKVAPVFSGSAASFQGGLTWSGGKTMQGVDIVGNNHLLLRTVGGANIRLEPQGSGIVSCSGDVSIQNAKTLKFAEATGNGVNTISLKAPDSVTANVVFELPAADGTSGQVIQTDSNGVLSFVDSGGVALGDANVWTGEQTFNLAIRKQFVVAEDIVHDAVTNATKRTLTAAEFGKLNIWNPTSVPTGDQRWDLPTGMPVGSVIWVAWANTHNTDKVHIYPPANELLYKQGSSGNLAYAGIEENEQEHFLKVSSTRWITG